MLSYSATACYGKMPATHATPFHWRYPFTSDNKSQYLAENLQPMPSLFAINTMQRGQTAIITAVDREGRDPVSARRLHEMGFDEGVDIELLHRAPLGGDPLALRVGNMTVALRQALAALVEIAPAPDQHAA